MNAANINAAVVIFACALIFHLNTVIAHGAVKNGKNGVSRAQHIFRFRQDDAVWRDKFVRLQRGVEHIVIFQNRIAADADKNGFAVLCNIVDMREIVFVNGLNIRPADEDGYDQNQQKQRNNIFFHRTQPPFREKCFSRRLRLDTVRQAQPVRFRGDGAAF